jgi:hypothetical protein
MVVTMNRLLQRGPLHGVKINTWSDVPSSYWAFEAIEEASLNHQSNRSTDIGEMLINSK